MYINTESIVKLENFRSAFGMIRARSGQDPIGMMHNLLSLLMQAGRSSKTSACFSFPLSQLPSKIASPISAPRAYTLRDFLWKQSRNSWPAGNCVMSKNPLSERSELWIFVNDLSSFRQALAFRSAATESPEGNSRRSVLSSDNRHLKANSPITPHPSPNAAHTSQPYSIPSAFSPALLP